MNFVLFFLLIIDASSLYSQDMRNHFKQFGMGSVSEKVEYTKREDCKDTFIIETKDGLGICVIKIDLDLLNSSLVKKDGPVAKKKIIGNELFEMNRNQLDLILERLKFIMSQKDNSIFNLYKF